MVAEGVLENPHVDAIFGLHVMPFEQGTLWVSLEAASWRSDVFRIVGLAGRRTGPCPGAASIRSAVSAQIVTGLDDRQPPGRSPTRPRS
jgi:metal-dependent amidase/aminoacylase/carboxypeptidase family protein